MRKLSGTLEQNSMLQVIVLGGLVLLLGLLLYVRVLNKSTSSTDAPPSAATPAATPAPPSDPADSSAPPAAPGETAGSATPSPDVPETPSTATPPEAAPVTPSAFEAMAPGPGLPAKVSRAYRQDKLVVLSIHQLGGVPERISLETLRRLQRSLGARHNIAIFTFDVRRISRYARITQGVNVNRVPALVVIKPFSLSQDGVPQAAVRYGYMGERNATQAVFDAAYSGPTLPYYPE